MLSVDRMRGQQLDSTSVPHTRPPCEISTADDNYNISSDTSTHTDGHGRAATNTQTLTRTHTPSSVHTAGA